MHQPLTKISGITQNLGIIPIDLRLTKLKSSYRTFVDYFSLEEIFTQLNNSESCYEGVLNCFNKNCVNCLTHLNDNVECVNS